MIRSHFLGIVSILFVALTTLPAQEQPVVPALAIKPTGEPSAGSRDLVKFTPQQRHFYLSAKSGMEWLQRVNKTDGRFLPGFIPALRVPLETDNYLHQAGAALALARAAAFYQDERAAAVAKQALLTLLLETAVDAKTQARYTAAPEAFVNRLASAGLLALAIQELPNPARDLLQHAAQLTQYLLVQQQPDGSFALGTDDKDSQAEIIRHCSGPALRALMRNQVRQGKLEATTKACAYYHAWWKQNKNAAMIPEHVAAYADAYLATKDQRFAEAVFDMNDWLCGLQYKNVDPRRAHWAGGFPPGSDGKTQTGAPDIFSAQAAASLVEACRVARAAGDAQRMQRYRTALDDCLFFVTTLQYAESNTQHFAEGYRHTILNGGFHLSHQDGNLRIDYTQHALAALVQHLKHTAELP